VEGEGFQLKPLLRRSRDTLRIGRDRDIHARIMSERTNNPQTHKNAYFQYFAPHSNDTDNDNNDK